MKQEHNLKSRSEPYRQGYRAAWRAAIRFINGEAARMVDPHAKDVLHVASHAMGIELFHIKADEMVEKGKAEAVKGKPSRAQIAKEALDRISNWFPDEQPVRAGVAPRMPGDVLHLVAAAKAYRDLVGWTYSVEEHAVGQELDLALAAFDPPIEYEYTMPTWGEYCAQHGVSSDGWAKLPGHGVINSTHYNAIREATKRQKGKS